MSRMDSMSNTERSDLVLTGITRLVDIIVTLDNEHKYTREVKDGVRLISKGVDELKRTRPEMIKEAKEKTVTESHMERDVPDETLEERLRESKEKRNGATFLTDENNLAKFQNNSLFD